MARILSQTLIRSSPSSIFSSSNCASLSPPSSRFLNLRNRSSRSEKAHLVEVDLEADGSDVEVLGMRRLEDAIHRIIVRQSAPDWLPFIPGSSYWVPPRKRPSAVAEIVGRLANPMSEEEALSLTTIRGWPSSVYFIDGASQQLTKKTSEDPHPAEKKSEDPHLVDKKSEMKASSEDEET